MSKTFIVTGATGGIGMQIVKLLLEEGGFVIATDINIRSLEILKNEFSKYQERLITEVLDVRKPELWEKVIQKAKSQAVPFYCLINSAGVLLPGYIIDSKVNDIDFHLDVNVKGTMIGSQIAAKYFASQRSGHIINIASLAAISPVPGIALYSASKFAVRGFTLALAMEMIPYNVNVTCICPDAVATPMLDLQKDYEAAAITFSGSNPLSAEEVATIVVDSIGEKDMEITINSWRGTQAKLAGMFPALASKLVSILRAKGIRNQNKFKGNAE